MYQQDQDAIVGQVYCDYQHFINSVYACRKCDSGSYQVDDINCYACSNSDLVPDTYEDKFDFICSGDSSYRIYNPFILVFAVFGAILLTLMFCICIIVLRLKGIICRGRNRRGGVNDRDAQREAEL